MTTRAFVKAGTGSRTLPALPGLMLFVALSGCAGYDTQVGAYYQDRSGDKVGVSVDVSKEIRLPKHFKK